MGGTVPVRIRASRVCFISMLLLLLLYNFSLVNFLWCGVLRDGVLRDDFLRGDVLRNVFQQLSNNKSFCTRCIHAFTRSRYVPDMVVTVSNSSVFTSSRLSSIENLNARRRIFSYSSFFQHILLSSSSSSSLIPFSIL